ncbi:hypothetical protein [Actinomadura atramentaria]|uniref:hypothetical protein n=1 Tax=Actinomadura atramentaria TaxID=1990 RepID=UPI00036BD331|nr:hypothetical protein [Actinomadura atramentaria]
MRRVAAVALVLACSALLPPKPGSAGAEPASAHGFAKEYAALKRRAEYLTGDRHHLGPATAPARPALR